MAITINAKTSGAGGLETTADNTGNINIQSGGSTVMSISSTGVSVTGSFSQDGAVYSTQPTFRNRIINGDMRISQRGTGTVNPNGAYTYSVDRTAVYTPTSGIITAGQSTASTPNNFTHSFLVTSTTATSVGAGDINIISHRIEGNNIADLAWGTANAKTVTLSFWVRSSLTGTFGGAFKNNAYNRNYVFEYTISAANTWEKKTITVAGDTTGTWESGISSGIQLVWSLGTGSTYSTTAGSWVAGQYFNATGSVNLVATSGATFYITGVQLEVGSTATDFEVLPYDVQLARCQRYTYKLGGEISNYYADSAGGYYDANYISFGKIRFPVPMRTAPSATFTAGGGINVWRGNTTYTGFSWNIVISGNPTTRDCFIVGNKTSHGVTVDAGAMIKFEDTAANCLFSAEL